MINQCHKCLPFLYGLLLVVFLLTIGVLAAIYPFQVLIPIIIISYLVVVLAWTGVIPPFTRKVFTPIKILTLATSLWIIPLTMLNDFPESWIQPVVIFFMILNMLEGVSVDIKEKHYLNAGSGILLIILTPIYFQITWDSPYILLLPSTIIFWILAHILWNWNMVLQNYKPEEAIFHFYVHMTPLILILLTLNISYWIEFRTITLLLAMTVHYSMGRQWLLPHLKFDKFQMLSAKLKTKTAQYVFLFLIVVLSGLTIILN